MLYTILSEDTKTVNIMINTNRYTTALVKTPEGDTLFLEIKDVETQGSLVQITDRQGRSFATHMSNVLISKNFHIADDEQ